MITQEERKRRTAYNRVWRAGHMDLCRSYDKKRYYNLRKNDRAKHIIYYIRGNCKSQGVPFNLTEEWLRPKLAGVCELSGLPFDMEGKKTRNSPSIDRINPFGGYTTDNCRVVLWSINRALCNYGEEYLLGVFKRILFKKGMI